jgi:hypothetical protein
MLQALRQPQQPEELSKRLTTAAAEQTGYDDTHPALRDRLAAIGLPDACRSAESLQAFLPGARNGSIALAGRNLWRSTKYTGSDPESSDQRDDTFARRDYYVFPTSRSFTVTLRMGF